MQLATAGQLWLAGRVKQIQIATTNSFVFKFLWESEFVSGGPGRIMMRQPRHVMMEQICVAVAGTASCS